LKLPHRRRQAGGARRGAKYLGQLLGDAGVRKAGGGDHVQDTLPHLVETVQTRDPSTLQESLDLGDVRIEYQRGHDARITARSAISRRLPASAGTMALLTGYEVPAKQDVDRLALLSRERRPQRTPSGDT
jgi:hypothetical protein